MGHCLRCCTTFTKFVKALNNSDSGAGSAGSAGNARLAEPCVSGAGRAVVDLLETIPPSIVLANPPMPPIMASMARCNRSSAACWDANPDSTFVSIVSRRSFKRFSIAANWAATPPSPPFLDDFGEAAAVAFDASLHFSSQQFCPRPQGVLFLLNTAHTLAAFGAAGWAAGGAAFGAAEEAAGGAAFGAGKEAAAEAAGGVAEEASFEPALPNGLKAPVLMGTEDEDPLDIVEKAFQITINLKFKPINFFLVFL